MTDSKWLKKCFLKKYSLSTRPPPPFIAYVLYLMLYFETFPLFVYPSGNYWLRPSVDITTPCICNGQSDFYHEKQKEQQPPSYEDKTISLYNPICSSGGKLCPLSRICEYLCKYTYERAEKLDFSQIWVWKRKLCFLPHKNISFRRKQNKVHQKYQNFIRGDP